VQTRREFDKHVMDLRARLEGSLRYRLLELSRRVHALTARSGFRRPQDLLRQQRQRADEFTARLALGLRARLEDSRKRLNNARLHVASFDFAQRLACSAFDCNGGTQELGAREERLLRVKRERWERLTLQLQEAESTESVGARLRHRHRRRWQRLARRGPSPDRRQRYPATSPRPTRYRSFAAKNRVRNRNGR